MRSYNFELDSENNVIVKELNFKLTRFTEEQLDNLLASLNSKSERDSLLLFLQAYLAKQEHA